jgi:hypothetical protein
MKRPGRLLVSSLMAISLVSCGVNLNEEEAARLITENLGLPRAVMTKVLVQRTPSETLPVEVIQGMESLVEDGYLRKPERGGNLLVPTEKGKKFVEGYVALENRFKVDRGIKNYSLFVGVVVKEVLKAIHEILIDEETKIAIISYTTGYERFEPLYSAICVVPECEYFGEGTEREEQRKIQLKKYDKGWRVLE